MEWKGYYAAKRILRKPIHHLLKGGRFQGQKIYISKRVDK